MTEEEFNKQIFDMEDTLLNILYEAIPDDSYYIFKDDILSILHECISIAIDFVESAVNKEDI